MHDGVQILDPHFTFNGRSYVNIMPVSNANKLCRLNFAFVGRTRGGLTTILFQFLMLCCAICGMVELKLCGLKDRLGGRNKTEIAHPNNGVSGKC